MAFDVSGVVIQSLGRRPDLTTRIPMWEDLLSVAPDPIVGAGYDIFWVTAPGLRMSERWSVAQAHNGYLELYLSLGITGLALTLAYMLSGLFTVRRDLAVDYTTSILRLCFIPIVMVYNWTEATFSGVSNMWLVFFLGALNVRGIMPPDPVSLASHEEPRVRAEMTTPLVQRWSPYAPARSVRVAERISATTHTR
jgi:O-antigen ligase